MFIYLDFIFGVNVDLCIVLNHLLEELVVAIFNNVDNKVLFIFVFLFLDFFWLLDRLLEVDVLLHHMAEDFLIELDRDFFVSQSQKLYDIEQLDILDTLA